MTSSAGHGPPTPPPTNAAPHRPHQHAAPQPPGIDPPDIPELLKTPVDRSALERGPLAQPKAGQSTGVSGMSVAYGLAVEFVVYIGVCAGLGYAVDHFLVGGNSVTWTVVGAVLGLVGAVIRLMRASQRLNR